MRKRKKQKLLISQWGKPKDQYRDMDLISAYFNSSRASISDFYINDRTWNDLDMDQVFEKIDRCESRIGQQKLYQLLRIQKEEKSELTAFLSKRFDLYFFKDELKNDRLTFNYQLNKGLPEKSNAIELLNLNSFPREIINDAIDFKRNNKIVLERKDTETRHRKD